MSRPILIGIAGGTGSGKTLVANTLIERLGSNRVVLIQQDAYYRDLPHLSFEERAGKILITQMPLMRNC